jgi:hypothetical protein
MVAFILGTSTTRNGQWGRRLSFWHSGWLIHAAHANAFCLFEFGDEESYGVGSRFAAAVEALHFKPLVFVQPSVRQAYVAHAQSIVMQLQARVRCERIANLPLILMGVDL